MHDPATSLKRRWQSGEATCGVILSSGSVVAAELAVLAGYDFVVVDLEFNLANLGRLGEFVLAARGSGTTVFVRVPNAERVWLEQCLAAGFDGIIVPDVRSVETASAIVAACQRPPLGRRANSSASRANRYDLSGGHIDAVIVAAMIESRAGCENAHAIASLPGIDLIVIGPYDLSAEIGAAGDFASPEFRRCFEQAEAGARQAAKPFGTAPFGDLSIEDLAGRGHQMLTMGSDVAHLRDAFRRQVQQFRRGGAAGRPNVSGKSDAGAGQVHADR